MKLNYLLINTFCIMFIPQLSYMFSTYNTSFMSATVSQKLNYSKL